MDGSTNYKLCVASAAFAVGCSVSFLIYKLRRRQRDAADLFNYLYINTVTDESTCDHVVRELRRRSQQYRALGIDCEWVTDNGKRQPVALVQLSSLDGYCGLFRLSSMKKLPASLKELLEDKAIYKVGVAAVDDGNYLYNDYSVELKSTLDIRHLAELNGFEAGGLATLSSELLNVVLDKSWRVRCSDWEAVKLSQRQVKYAAIDAHVAIKIFAILLEQIVQKDESFSLSGKDYHNKIWSNIDKYCSKYADVPFKIKHVKLKDGAKDTDSKNKDASLPSKGYKHAMRDKRLYNNGYLEAPDGELLCRCDNKKALWFVNKELGDIVKEEPLTVRLRFEPAGRAVGDVGRYYQLEKENKCVVCGGTGSYNRKNVVPREYRKMFPDIMKEHASHDVVLLCADCHQLSNMRDHAMRERLADMCNAPLAHNRGKTSSEEPDLKKIKSIARALLHYTDQIPEERRKKLEATLLQYFPDKQEVTEELLKKMTDPQFVLENSDDGSHGVKVVEYFFKRHGLLRLEELWREHFLNSMVPRHMPDLWSVKHNEEKLKIKWNEGRITQEHLISMGLTRL